MVVKQSSFILKKLELFARPTTAARFVQTGFGWSIGGLAGQDSAKRSEVWPE